MSVLGTVIMGLDGVAYLALGACMLAAPRIPRVRPLATLYPSLFRPLRELSACDPEAPSVVLPVADLMHDLGYRMMAYLLFVFGLARTLTAFHWGCGYVYLGLSTCLAEVGMVCHELLRQESMYVHGAVAAIVGNMFLGMAYICVAVPRCA
jgi:hypothetical protein